MSAPATRLAVEVWALWVKTYGAAGAIALALRSGYTRQQIRDANTEALRLAGA